MSDKFAENVRKSPEAMAKTLNAIQADAMNNDAIEAARSAEIIIEWLQGEWGEKGFTPEQCVFALALATINFRETVPSEYGGKDMFDRVAGEARRYYDKNSGRK